VRGFGGGGGERFRGARQRLGGRATCGGVGEEEGWSVRARGTVAKAYRVLRSTGS
jgi:hypothetical protein